MTRFKIITLEEFETFKKGDEINNIEFENINEAKKWAYEQYGPYGENIRHKVVRC